MGSTHTEVDSSCRIQLAFTKETLDPKPRLRGPQKRGLLPADLRDFLRKGVFQGASTSLGPQP